MEQYEVRRSGLRMWLLSLAGVPLLVLGVDVLRSRRIFTFFQNLIWPNGNPELLEPRDYIWAVALIVVGLALAIFGVTELINPRPVLATSPEGVWLRAGHPFSSLRLIPWTELVDVGAEQLDDEGDVVPVLLITVDDPSRLPHSSLGCPLAGTEHAGGDDLRLGAGEPGCRGQDHRSGDGGVPHSRPGRAVTKSPLAGVGAHVDGADPRAEATARGADLVQIFLSDPQGWKKPDPHPLAAELAADPLPIYVHSPYLINVVAEASRIRIPSRRILQETCDAAATIGAVGVVVHGGHLTGDGPIEEGYDRWRKALLEVDSEIPILIENTASGDNAVCRRVDSLARLWQVVGDLGPGFVLDTCHSWAGGEPGDELVERVLAATGRIDLIHCNDSRDPFDSRRDRHANLGAGEIPTSLLEQVVATAGAPVVVETPGGVEDHRRDMEFVRRAVGALQ